MADRADGKEKPAASRSGRSAVDGGRRSVLGAIFGSFLGLGFAALGAAGGLWALATGRLMMPNVLTEPASRFKVGFPGDYPPGYVQTKFKQKHGVFVIHGTDRGKGHIYALKTVCTHLGCIVLWQENEQKFKCPCHGSGFSRDGINLEGPAPRPLERYAIRIADDGQLEVDKSKLFQEELGQWDDPASHVSV